MFSAQLLLITRGALVSLFLGGPQKAGRSGEPERRRRLLMGSSEGLIASIEGRKLRMKRVTASLLALRRFEEAMWFCEVIAVEVKIGPVN